MPETTPKIDYRAQIAKLLAGEDPRLGRATICLSRAATREYEKANTAYGIAAAKAKRDPETGETKTKLAGGLVDADRAVKAAKAAYDANCVNVVFRALSDAQWWKLQARWQSELAEMTTDQEKIVHGKTTDRELVLDCFLRFETLDGEVIEGLDRSTLEQLTDPDNGNALTNPEVAALTNAAVSLCVSGPDLPI